MGDARTETGLPTTRRTPLRLLVVMPSWVGDCVMATPALRLVRETLAGAFIGVLVRPGMDELLAGTALFDEVHVDRARGVMGPKLVASKIRPRGYDTAMLLTNSFSTALITRLAFIPRRVGYDRDARGLLLTDRLKPERRGVLGYACVPAVEYYLNVARRVLGEHTGRGETARAPRLELWVTGEQDAAAAQVLVKTGVVAGERYVVLNPGGNNPAKRWAAERFAAVAAHVVRTRGWKVLVSGSAGEREVVDAVVGIARHELSEARSEESRVRSLVDAGITLGSLKGVLRGAAALVTNDTGPRHIGAALGTSVVTLYGPTDPRWTTLPGDGARWRDLVADPTLPADQIADDHPGRCRMDRIEVSAVVRALEEVLAAPGSI